MNKNKKIAMAVVATVMAGTMVVPLAACNNDGGSGGGVDLEKWTVLDADGNLNYDAYKRDTPVTLNIAIGHNGDTTSTAFAAGAAVELPDGVTYQSGEMKPAWKQMGADLNITWNDVFVGDKTGQTNANLNTIVSNQGKVSYDQTDMFTTDLSIVVSQISKGVDILNLADYLEYMPNFKSFLEANPIVYLSLLQDGMSTTDGSGKSLYVAPYFDGNDDIERYCIIRQDWATKLLDGADITGGDAFNAKCAATTSVLPFMTGLTALKVDVTDPTPDEKGEYTKDAVVYKNYANVKDQIKKSGTALYTAYHAIANADYPEAGEGNIVAIMNAAIAADNTVTGSKLVALLRAYIDACYTKTDAIGAEKYYTNRADLFNGYDAAWDVDDLVAILRCVMTNQSALLSSGKTQAFGIAPRSGQNDRTPDLVRLACQLYGVRGADSRYEYTYIDNAGVLQDARNDKEFYQACDNMNKLRAEGLIVDYSGKSNFLNEGGYYANNPKKNNQQNAETFMMYDYCQTQTAVGFYTGEGVTGVDLPKGYNFAPILTPVSKWDVNGDKSIGNDEYFRFTESWRSTKTSGLALNGGLAKDKDKLKAALQFVDYLYSKDGQIVSTYGPQAKNAQGEGGFWYDDKATDAQITAGQYYTYKGEKYHGSLYKGNYTPTVTNAVKDSFKGTGDKALPEKVADAKLSFTNYARMLIGSTLPIGVKDQSFEDQLTSKIGKAGSAKVAAALANEIGETGYTVIRGMSLDINESKWWYTCVPTGLPVPTVDKPTLDDTKMNMLKYMSGEAKTSGDKNFFSIFNHVILFGTGTAYGQQEQNYTFATTDTINALTTYMSTERFAQERENTLALGWNQAKNYWNYLKPKAN